MYHCVIPIFTSAILIPAAKIVCIRKIGRLYSVKSFDNFPDGILLQENRTTMLITAVKPSKNETALFLIPKRKTAMLRAVKIIKPMIPKGICF